MGVGSVDGPKVASSKEVEVRPILAAIIDASARDFCKVCILYYALEVVQPISGSFDWSFHPILHDI